MSPHCWPACGLSAWAVRSQPTPTSLRWRSSTRPRFIPPTSILAGSRAYAGRTRSAAKAKMVQWRRPVPVGPHRFAGTCAAGEPVRVERRRVGSRKMGRSSFRPPARMLNGHWVEAENQFRVIGGGVSGLKSSRRSSPLHGHNGRHIRQFRSVRGLRSAIRGARDRHSRSGSRVQSHFGAVATHASAQRRR